MIKINVKKVLKEDAEKKLKVKPLPKIRIKSKQEEVPANGGLIEEKVVVSIEAVTLPVQTDIKAQLISSLELELGLVKKDRAKLSTRIGQRIEAGATQEDLAKLYEEIESFRPQMVQIHNNIEYVKQHGKLPDLTETKETVSEDSLLVLKDKKRKLSDKRCKLKKKLIPSGKPAKSESITNWQIELAQANAEYEDVEMKIKKLESKA